MVQRGGYCFFHTVKLPGVLLATERSGLTEAQMQGQQRVNVFNKKMLTSANDAENFFLHIPHLDNNGINKKFTSSFINE